MLEKKLNCEWLNYSGPNLLLQMQCLYALHLFAAETHKNFYNSMAVEAAALENNKYDVKELMNSSM